MNVQCHVCGRKVSVASWSKEYERLKKSSNDPAYVCDVCQDKIRAETQKDQPR